MKQILFRTALPALLCVTSAAPATAEPWRFGVMGDTQWKANLDGENPETVAVGIIQQINEEFIAHGVDFVIQVGDLVDKETDSPNGNPANRTIDTRAAAAQSLYDVGIGFFPLRGNHESSATAAAEVPVLFPQTTGSGPNVNGASNFSSPFATLNGLSYSFDYKNARFVLFDQFTRTDGTNYLGSSNNNIVDQIDWAKERLSTKGAHRHGFAFSHKNLIGANHVDSLFGADPSANADAQNAFYAALFDNGVRYHFSGHDHNHLRSMVLSPDGVSYLQNIIAASNSYKFYLPKTPSIDQTYNLPTFGFLRETPIVQELFTVGYYIVTVDGARVTVEHFASDNGCGGTLGSSIDCDLTTTPELAFSKREAFGYGLNGQSFLVGQGQSYQVVQDTYRGTTARILHGQNQSVAKIHDERATTKDVNTGWEPRHQGPQGRLASNILNLWGLADYASPQTDTYVLSISYDALPWWQLLTGSVGIAVRNSEGKWVNAVDENTGGTARFVIGPWREQYSLGAYGVDLKSRTAWAVVNHEGEFAVSSDVRCQRKHHGHRD